MGLDTGFLRKSSKELVDHEEIQQRFYMNQWFLLRIESEKKHSKTVTEADAVKHLIGAFRNYMTVEQIEAANLAMSWDNLVVAIKLGDIKNDV